MNSHIQLNEAGEFLRYIPAGITIEWDENNYCTPEALIKDGKAEQFRIVEMAEVEAPLCDPMTQALTKGNPVLVEGIWTPQWKVTDLSPEQIAANLSAKTEKEARLVAEKVEALWQAADRYTSSYISGVAIGILAIGVIQQKPKALAVSDWSSRVWKEYYVRKSQVTKDSEDNHDFSSFGAIPYSVPELQAEVGL